MTEFEMILAALLIPVCLVFAYIAGRMNLIELVLKMAKEKLVELDRYRFSGREYVEMTGKCPMCEDCPDNCPIER